MAFKDQLDLINQIYYDKSDPRSLFDAQVELNALLAAKDLDAKLRRLAVGLGIRLDSKLALVQYLNTFAEGDYSSCRQRIEQNLATAKAQDYEQTLIVLKGFGSLALNVNAVVGEVEQYMCVFTSSGVVADETLAEKALASVRCAKDNLQVCKLSFGEGDHPKLRDIYFGDIAKSVSRYLNQREQVFCKVYSNAIKQRLSNCFEDIGRYYISNEYFPLPANDEGGKSNTLVLSTPFKEDARLFAARQCEQNKLFCLDANSVKNPSVEFFQMALKYIADEQANCVLENVSTLSPDICDGLLLCVMRMRDPKVKVYLTDTDGRALLYKRALALASEQSDVNITDISLEYISLPIFEQVQRELEQKEMVDSATSAQLVKSMPFVGFEGLNRIVRTFVSRGDWRALGKQISHQNTRAVQIYLENIPAVYLLLDSGYGDFSQYDKQSDDGFGGFDYDAVSHVDKANVKLIMESTESVFARCGMITRYCTVGVDDFSVWTLLDRQMQFDRINLAVRLVYQILHVDYIGIPKVELLDELDNKTAGGVCCDGGKLIQIKFSTAQDIAWLMRCINHECFHALQGKLTNGHWCNWYYFNMGISSNRVRLWSETRQIYDANTGSNIYKVHMYEADARTFEYDCEEAGAASWSNINFK